MPQTIVNKAKIGLNTTIDVEEKTKKIKYELAIIGALLILALIIPKIFNIKDRCNNVYGIKPKAPKSKYTSRKSLCADRPLEANSIVDK